MKAKLAVVATDAVAVYEALRTDIEAVWFERTTGLPFTVKDPVILTDPVKS